MKPLDHPDYLIPGTNILNFSRWSRENEPKDPSPFKIGDEVYVLCCAEVVRIYEDCDGTPLHALDNGQKGYSAASLSATSDSPVASEYPEELDVRALFAEIRSLRAELERLKP